MISIETARLLALALPEVEEKSHFDKPDFRVRNKIFASLHLEKQVMMLKLPLVEQSVFCEIDPAIIYPVPGGWGHNGATFFLLQKLKKKLLEEALTIAWKTVAPTTLVKKYFPAPEIG